MSKIPCYFLEPTDQTQQYLRRYTSGSAIQCPAYDPATSRATRFMSGHNAQVKIERGELIPGSIPGTWSIDGKDVDHADRRWPKECDQCRQYEFTDEDVWQVFAPRLFRRTDTGELLDLREAPPGALWYADWLDGVYPPGPDGKILMCKTPGGDWCIDSEASNCTRKGDKTHKCWVRHGDPTDPLGLTTGQPLHVDKNGDTCAAGAGSIQCGQYHGFLHSGHLTP